jgi:hypothetical protein
VCRLIAKYDNEQFAETVWKRDEKGRTWQLMYFLTEPVEVGRRLSEFEDYLEPDRYWGWTIQTYLLWQYKKAGSS